MLGILPACRPRSPINLVVGRKGLRSAPQFCNRRALKIAGDEEDYDLSPKGGQNYVGRPRKKFPRDGWHPRHEPVRTAWRRVAYFSGCTLPRTGTRISGGAGGGAKYSAR